MKKSAFLITLGLILGLSGSIIFDVSWHFNRTNLNELQTQIYNKCYNTMKTSDVEFADGRSILRGCHCVALEVSERIAPQYENETISLMGSYIKYHLQYIINYGIIPRKTTGGRVRLSQQEIENTRKEWKQIMRENHPNLSGSLYPHRSSISKAYGLCGKVKL